MLASTDVKSGHFDLPYQGHSSPGECLDLFCTLLQALCWDIMPGRKYRDKETLQNGMADRRRRCSAWSCWVQQLIVAPTACAHQCLGEQLRRREHSLGCALLRQFQELRKPLGEIVENLG